MIMQQPPTCLGFNPPVSPPRQRLPRNTTDSHVFNLAALSLDRSTQLHPAPASLNDYLQMCEVMGINRTVQVNVSVYGFDNSLTRGCVVAPSSVKNWNSCAGTSPGLPLPMDGTSQPHRRCGAAAEESVPGRHHPRRDVAGIYAALGSRIPGSPY
jgi:hypothetical protein